MALTNRELWTALHGMLLGAAFLLCFTGSAVGIWMQRAEWATPAGQDKGMRLLLAGVWAMAVLAWMTVVLGTFVIYPWYRAPRPAGAALAEYPKALLISKPETAQWHEFGMEWKEHIGWLAPIFATGVAVAATACRRTLANERRLRQTMLAMLNFAFFCAGVAGFFGAMINKMAPVR